MSALLMAGITGSALLSTKLKAQERHQIAREIKPATNTDRLTRPNLTRPNLTRPVVEFEASPLLPIDRRQGSKWIRVGMVRVGNGGTIDQATALLVSQCHAMTAAHVVVQSKGSLTREPIRVWFGKNLERPSVARPVAWGRYVARTSGEGARDWAVLRLDTCLGRGLGYLRLAGISKRQALARGRTLQLAGYPSDRAGNTLLVSRRCGILLQNNRRLGGWLTGCSLTKGISGGPVFAGVSVVAIAVAETHTLKGRTRRLPSANFANVVLPVGRILSALRRRNRATYDFIMADQRRLRRGRKKPKAQIKRKTEPGMETEIPWVDLPVK